LFERVNVPAEQSVPAHEHDGVRAGTLFPERAQDRLQERARAIIERRPDLERFFDG
jgi:hypothetical protein